MTTNNNGNSDPQSPPNTPPAPSPPQQQTQTPTIEQAYQLRMNALKKLGVADEMNAELKSVMEHLAGRSLAIDLAHIALKTEESPYLQSNADVRTRVAATDLFVEKAQYILTSRAKRYERIGWVSFSAAGAVILAGAAISWYRLRAQIDVGNGYQLTIAILRALTFAGFILVAAKGGLAVGRAFMHESIRLYERRHAMRFGRLAMHLFTQDMTPEQVKATFEWNRDVDSAFKDLVPEKVTETVQAQAIKTLGEVTTKLSEALGSVRRGPETPPASSGGTD